mmetsp:Transcript_11444/g.19350  ORF Transcript_11444/g.19350 Transcript_11444/m.19350 type:complete len:182 (+) Transcript_11444:80-625(+)
MPPYRPPHMRNAPPMPKLVLVNRNETILTQPSQTDTVASLMTNLAEEFHVPEELISLQRDGAPLTNMSEKLADFGSVNIQVTVQQASHEQMEKYIRSKGSEHFLGAELKLTTQGGDELKGELYCVQDGDSSCILRQHLPDGNANYFWLKWNTIKSISIESMPDKKRTEFWPAVNLQALERR